MIDDVPRIVDSLSAREHGRHKKRKRDNDKWNAAVQKKMTEHDCFSCSHFAADCDPFGKCKRRGG